jgi:hypothetical protein
LTGNNDIEDALKRLDRLTQEEARMASAQLLKVTNAIDSEVREIADNVLVVDDRVKDVDDKLVAVIDGAQCIFNQSSQIVQLLIPLDGKEARGVIQQAADGVDRIVRSWFPTAFMLDMQSQSLQQGINYDRIFVDGSRHKIHLQITLSHATPITRERRPGFSKEGRTRNGSQQVLSHYSGFMENVCPVPFCRTPHNNIPYL